MTRVHILRTCLAALFTAALLAACGGGQEGGDPLAGWERGGAYDSKYDPAELDSIKGYYQETYEFSADGLATGLGLVLEDRADGELVRVHLGPKGFVGPLLEKFDLRRGQKVKVKGVWVTFDGEDLMVASKVKKGEFEQLKVRRTLDGTPYWSMSPEELEQERAEAFEEDE